MMARRRLASRPPTPGSNPQVLVSLFDGSSRTTPTVPVSQICDPTADRPAPRREEIQSQVERILASSAFDASERNRAFLRYVVEETMAGRTEYIKGYTVALKVFNRDPDFDPQLDPVVRIEASRLRRSLERYYFTAGRFDRIRVELPKGGYVPRFEVNEDSASIADPAAGPTPTPGSRPAALRYVNPAVIVLGFENLGDDPRPMDISRGIVEELVGRLTQYDNLMVFAVNTSFKRGPIDDLPEMRRDLAIGYVLKGGIRIWGSRLRISVQLLDLSDGRFLWAERFDHELNANDIWVLQEQIAEAIATCIAAPHGAIWRLSSRKLLQARSSGLTS